MIKIPILIQSFFKKLKHMQKKNFALEMFSKSEVKQNLIFPSGSDRLSVYLRLVLPRWEIFTLGSS